MTIRKVFCGIVGLALIAAFTAISLGAFAQATPPARINYQGVLRDASGNPLNGSQTMTFRFYDAASAGTLLWEEIYDTTIHPPQVTVSTGLFTLALGDPAHRNAGSEISFSNVFALHATVYLAVAASTDPEMTPRIQALAAPFAQNADTLDGRDSAIYAKLTSADAINANWVNTAYPWADNEVSNLLTLGAGSTIDPSIAVGNANTLDTFDSSYFLNTSATAQTKAGTLTLAAPLDYGVDASGTLGGGYFHNSTFSGYARAGYGDYGIYALGNESGGYFADFNSSGYAYVGIGDYGIEAFGNTTGGYFHGPGSGYANVATGGYGIAAYGNTMGGYFVDLDSSAYAYVGYSTYKIQGSGTVSFVQNHPTEKDKVIVYACPEGDEIATYTRGTARLVNGEARVKLGETFQWVTNPDIGMTVHLTPHGEAVPLAVVSLSTTELVVKGPKDGLANLVFDYMVYGLRIGFEESSIVQEKLRESYIPSFEDHRERYAKYPELRAFNSLERFKTMDSTVRDIAPGSIDLSRAKALKEAIHEYDPATDPPVDKLFGHGPGRQENELPPASGRPDMPPRPAAGRDTITPAIQADSGGNGAPAFPVDSDGNVFGKSFRPTSPDFASSFPVCGPVEAGDVLVTDANHPGLFCRSLVSNDPGVVGVVAGEPGVLLGSAPKGSEPRTLRAPVATGGVVLVKVDAGYGPIAMNDLLVASPTAGHAMHGENPAQGTVIGKALEPLAGGTGLIKVLVMLR